MIQTLQENPMAKKKTRKKTVRRKKAAKRIRFGVPALSTLIKQPVRTLKSARDKIETAIEVKAAPGMFSDSGRRLAIGPRKPRGYKAPKAKRQRAQKLPPEIAHIFA
jgi:hypothetical protein